MTLLFPGNIWLRAWVSSYGIIMNLARLHPSMTKWYRDLETVIRRRVFYPNTLEVIAPNWIKDSLLYELGLKKKKMLHIFPFFSPHQPKYKGGLLMNGLLTTPDLMMNWDRTKGKPWEHQFCDFGQAISIVLAWSFKCWHRIDPN